MVAGGLVRYDADGYRSVLGGDEVDPLHAVRVMEFAKAMIEVRPAGRPSPAAE